MLTKLFLLVPCNHRCVCKLKIFLPFVSNNDTRSNFLKEQNQNCSRPQAFAKVTYHGFFKCEGKYYPNTQLEIVLENIIINYILLMMFNFNYLFYIFYSIIITDVIIILGCYIGSLMEMNQDYYFLLIFLLILC